VILHLGRAANTTLGIDAITVVEGQKVSFVVGFHPLDDL